MMFYGLGGCLRAWEQAGGLQLHLGAVHRVHSLLEG